MHDPRVPETLEGWSLLHQMFRVRWPEWRARPDPERKTVATEAAQALAAMQRGEAGATAAVALLGHKGDLMLVHFRRDFEELHAAQLAVARLGLASVLEPTAAYAPIVDPRRYEMTGQVDARPGKN